MNPSRAVSLLKTNLRLLQNQLGSIFSTPFFNEDLHEFIGQLLDVISVLLNKTVRDQPKVAEQMARQIWRISHYLSGSKTSTLPYEVVFALEHALKEWTDGDYVISTAVTQDRNFHFSGVPENFYFVAGVVADVQFKRRIVQMALPELYRHRPLYGLVLYHELGHFVDEQLKISGFAKILMDSDHDAFPGLSSRPEDWSEDQYDNALIAHAKEYFADLFATSYLGKAMPEYLGEFAGGERLSTSHPDTYERTAVMDAALEGERHVVIEHMTAALRSQKKVNIDDFSPRFELPDIKPRFDEVRPCALQNIAQVHGMFPAGWAYLKEAMNTLPKPWNEFPESDVERVINDLTEKSIRNYMICEKWNDGTVR